MKADTWKTMVADRARFTGNLFWKCTICGHVVHYSEGKEDLIHDCVTNPGNPNPSTQDTGR